MGFYWLVLGILGVWRLTHLLNAEDGPADLLVRMRQWVGSGPGGRLLDCFECLSLLVAIPFAFEICDTWGERIAFWLAASGGAIMLERLSSPATVAAFRED